MTVYAWGYQGRTLEELRAHRDRLDALIVDVRLTPMSRVGAFRRQALQRAFGADYLWIKEFGNLNYRTAGSEIAIADPVAGLARLDQSGISDRRPPLLLCVCPTPRCHRTTVAAFLAAERGWGSVDLTAGGSAMPRG